MIEHLTLNVRSFATSSAFYDAALVPLGYRRLAHDRPAAAYESSEGLPEFQIVERGEPGGPLHIALKAPSTESVDRFHAAALEAGGQDNGAPGLRPHYHAGYYAAFVIDPDGNNVEAVFQNR